MLIESKEECMLCVWFLHLSECRNRFERL